MKIRRLQYGETIPFDLLLEADPSIPMIESYFSYDYTFVAEENGIIVGVYILYPLGNDSIELKNISVLEKYQRQGIGLSMLHHAEETAKAGGYKMLIVGTADVSHAPLKFYQQYGFRIYGIKKNFVIDNYSEPVYDNGEQCIDMIMLEKEI